jgi:hypothetical protein
MSSETFDPSGELTNSFLRFVPVLGAYARLEMRLASTGALVGRSEARLPKPEELVLLERRLTSEKRSRAEAAVGDLAALIAPEMQNLFPKTDPSANIDDLWLPSSEEVVTIALSELGSRSASEAEQKFLEACAGDEETAAYAFAYLQWTRAEDLGVVLREGLLVLLVVALEDYVAALLRCLMRFRSPAKRDDPDVISELRRITAEVSKVMGGRIDAWLMDIESTNTPVEELMEGRFVDVREIFARRNAVVHGSTRADHAYVHRTKKFGLDVRLGGSLTIDTAYVTSAVTLVEELTDLIAVGLATYVSPGLVAAARWGTKPVLRALQGKRWRAAKFMAERLLADFAPDHEFTELRVNLWMARQELGDRDVDMEIQEWEPSGDTKDNVAHAALQHDAEATLRLVNEGISGGTFSSDDLRSWPLIVRLCEESTEFAGAYRILRARGGRRPPTRRGGRRPKRR